MLVFMNKKTAAETANLLKTAHEVFASIASQQHKPPRFEDGRWIYPAQSSEYYQAADKAHRCKNLIDSFEKGAK
jgi:hypothetical protein